MNLLNEINSFKENGFVKIKSFLSQHEVDEVINAVTPFINFKNDKITYFSTNFKKNLIKLCKFEFSKFLSSNYLMKISK